MKKEFIVLIAVSALFVLVSFLVWITRGNNAYLIRKKLKLGSMIILLTSTTVVSGVGCIKCYAPVPQYFPSDRIILSEEAKGAITVDMALTDTIAGTIEFRKNENYSFRIIDSVGTIVQEQDILALDGLYDDRAEEFEIVIDSDIDSGTYRFIFFYAPLSMIDGDRDYTIREFDLTITNNI